MDWLAHLIRAIHEFDKNPDLHGMDLKKESIENVLPDTYIVTYNIVINVIPPDKNINIDQSTNYGARVHGSIQGNITDSLNTINKFKEESGDQSNLASALKNLHETVQELIKHLPPEMAEHASRDLKILVDEAASKKPRKQWYEISASGLIEAAKTVAKMAAPVTIAVNAVLSLLAR